MSGRSPARFLAPIALLVTTLALLVVVAGGSGDGGSATEPESGATRPTATTPTTTTRSRTSTRRSRRYTVKAGDTPSSIAEEAGIPLDELLELNPDIDPQALAPGQRLRLGP